MAFPTTDFTKDIVLDNENFTNACKRLNELASRINTLENNVSNSLEALKAGFDTPAGRKFFEVCGTKLLDPMKDQARVINHVSENLQNAQDSYRTVFEDFKKLNSSIAKYSK